MESKDLQLIKKQNWFLFITRPMEIFTFYCNSRAYIDLKKKYLGFGWKKIGYLYHRGLVEFYRDRKEWTNHLSKLKRLIIKTPKKINKILDEGMIINQRMKAKIKKYKTLKTLQNSLNIFNQEVEFYTYQFVVTTIVPYFTGLILEDLNPKKYASIWKKIEKLRASVDYLTYKNVVINKIFEEIIEQYNLPKNIYLFDFFPEEILQIIKGRLRLNTKRKNYFYYFNINERIIAGENKNDYQKIEKIIKAKTPHKTSPWGKKNRGLNLIKGKSAFPGKVKGRVKIVFDTKDFKRFKPNDILVSISSNPSLMPIIKKASAIITDEGGLTCHGAIISRELKIPCVIGTKIATKVLKDGDLVEVDANKGMVKILKKKK